ncbi:CRISPR-associated endonuclease Cas3'' [Saccharomonospora sp. CUA-673]|nr:CRISPR-associated endonuclease Cas3'' [Saccharomonospora sp. CUA-673]
MWHLVDAAGAASALWDRHIGPGMRRWLAQRLDLDEEMTRRLVVELAGLHDIGKATAPFQQQWDQSQHGYVRHDRAAATVLPLLLDPRLTRAGLAASAAFTAALAVAGHHAHTRCCDARTPHVLPGQMCLGSRMTPDGMRFAGRS